MYKNSDIIDIRCIMDMLPHRYPFLLVDRVLQLDKEQRTIKAYKNVTMNEQFFQGHFPDIPVMPGVLILEALAQAAGLFLLFSQEVDLIGKLFLFTGMDRVRFRRPVVPGDQLLLHISDVRHKMNIWKMAGIAEVAGETAAAGEFSAAIVNKENL